MKKMCFKSSEKRDLESLGNSVRMKGPSYPAVLLLITMAFFVQWVCRERNVNLTLSDAEKNITPYRDDQVQLFRDFKTGEEFTHYGVLVRAISICFPALRLYPN